MALFLLVMALFALVLIRPGIGARAAPKAWIVGGGLVLPAIVLLPLVGYAFVVGERLLPVSGAPPRIEVTAQQFAWTFRYPEHGGGATVDVLHLPAGEPIDMEIRSLDVIHSFWLPRAAGKLDAVPGHVTRLRLEIDEPGRYEGLCAEFCGLGHAHMRFDVIVHAPEDYAAAVAEAAE
ncbi:hypothetical protein BH23PSE1_BH23PSE1_08160 [soil metagenome]